MAESILTPEVLALVAERVAESGLGPANTSKHLGLLHQAGFVTRRKDGLVVPYALADRSGVTLCDMVCGRLEAQLVVRQRLFAA